MYTVYTLLYLVGLGLYMPRALWLPILYGVILNVRPAATARNYKKIWRKESNESPLRYYTRAQGEALCPARNARHRALRHRPGRLPRL